MTGGTQPFHLSKDTPYPISSFDAPVVTRVLEAGGTITGTSTCENYCMSALSFSSATGPVDNPWLKGYECGGSSSGSAALVAVKSVRRQREKVGGQVLSNDDLGEGVDLAIGGDQGGSIRMVSILVRSLELQYSNKQSSQRRIAASMASSQRTAWFLTRELYLSIHRLTTVDRWPDPFATPLCCSRSWQDGTASTRA